MKPVKSCNLFGAYKACIGFKDVVVLFHSIVGCDIGTLVYHLPGNTEDVRQVCSVVHEKEVIGGGMLRLKQALQETASLYPHMSAIIVITGCIPSMIGDDVELVIEEAKLGIPVLHIAASGMSGDEDLGYENALLKLTESLQSKSVEGGSVNILGFSMDDPRAESDLIAIKNFLEPELKVQTVFSMGSWSDLKKATQACLNIVVGKGHKAAEYMEMMFGIPYIVVDYPYGLYGMEIWARLIEEKTGVSLIAKLDHYRKDIMPALNKISHYLQSIYRLPVAVCGNKTHAIGMRLFLEEELGMQVVVYNDCSQPDMTRFNEELQKSTAVLLFGSSFYNAVAVRKDIPLVKFCYPVFDQIFLGYKPFVGMEGVLNLIEAILNSLWRHTYKTRGAFVSFVESAGCAQGDYHED